MKNKRPKVLELCTGGGGQALGLHWSGFDLIAGVEIEARFCETLKFNRPEWNIINADLKTFSAKKFKGVDLIAGGVPCPPFSVAGKQLGTKDERDMFPHALRIIEEANPKAVLLENVPGFASAKFEGYRQSLMSQLANLGYIPFSRVVNSSDYGVPQLRPRFILVALKPKYAKHFVWPKPTTKKKTVGITLLDLMAAGGWRYANEWALKANAIAPTLVGGSTKHGGPDLGPTRAREKWLTLNVDGSGISSFAPLESHPADHVPKLTVEMAARIQGFPDAWKFVGGKTIAYRQIGNAFPPPVAKAVGKSIFKALKNGG